MAILRFEHSTLWIRVEQRNHSTMAASGMKRVEKGIFYILTAFQSLSHSEFTLGSEFVRLNRIGLIEYCLNSTGHRA